MVSIERPVVMGLREKNIRLMKEIKFYRNCKERNSRYRLEMTHTHTHTHKMLWSVSQV